MTLLALATLLMFAQQGLAAFSKTVVPVIAPVMAAGLGVDASLTGLWVAAAAVAGIPTTLACGGMIRRWGSLRVSSAATAMMAAGFALAVPAVMPLALALALQLLSAIIIGAGSTVSTPASSQLLARLSPPRRAPLVFSIKQTGVPAGLALAGAVGPWLTEAHGWRFCLLVAALINLALALLLEPTRKLFDTDLDPQARIGLSDVRATVAGVLRDAGLRRLAMTCFVFVGLQITVQSFLVLHLVQGIGYGLSEAGWVFGVATLVAIPARVFWGWLGGFVAAARLLAGFGFGMFLACCGLALLPVGAPPWLALAAGVGASATALSWHGVLMAEIARLSPPGQVGAMTGGVLSFAGLGQVVLPATFAVLLRLGVPYPAAWPLIALPALLVAPSLLRRPSVP